MNLDITQPSGPSGSGQEIRLASGDRQIGTYWLGHDGQLFITVLYATPANLRSQDERLAVLWLAVTYRQRHDPQASDALTNGVALFQQLVGECPRHVYRLHSGQAERQLREQGILVVADRVNYRDVLDEVVNRSGLPGVSYQEVGPTRYATCLRFRFTVEAPRQFRFWHAVDSPSPDSPAYDFDVIPSYHPRLMGWREVALINGDGDGVIRNIALQRVYAPPETRAPRLGVASWSSMLHPMRAEGRAFEAEISLPRLLSPDARAELHRFLLGALELHDTYVAVNGGFVPPPPFRHPSLDVPGVRGSEHHCAWTYHTLVAEGKLDGSYVPPWFTEEGWLERYPAPQ